MGVFHGLDGDGRERPTVLVRTPVDRHRVCGGAAQPGRRHSRRKPDHRLRAVQPLVEVPLVRGPERGEVEVLGADELLFGSGEFEDLVDAERTRPRPRDDIPAARLQDQAVRFQAALHIGGLTPAAVPDVQDAAVPDGVGDGGQIWGLVGVRVPAGRVQVEAAADPVGVLAQLAREGRAHLELGGGEDRAEAQLGGGAGDAREEECLGLVGGEAGEAGAVAVQEAVAARVARVAVQRDAGRAQRLDIPVDRAHRDLQLLGELGGGHTAAGLEEQEDRDEPRGFHLTRIPDPTDFADRRCQ